MKTAGPVMSSADFLYGTEPNAFLKARASLLPKTGRALAVADGEGRNGVWLAEQGLDVLSIDFSPTAQAKARALAQDRNVSIATELADATTWRWPEAEFDLVALIFTQFATPTERSAMFGGIRRTLKPGGLLLIQGYAPRQLQFG